MLLALPIANGATANEKRNTLSENLSVTEIEKDVFIVTHSIPWASNSLLIRTRIPIAYWSTPCAIIKAQGCWSIG